MGVIEQGEIVLDTFAVKPPFRRVVVATDGSDLSAVAIKGGSLLASRIGAALHVFHASSDLPTEALVEKQAAQLLEPGTYQLAIRGVPPGGSPADVIAAYATTLGSAVIVVGTHGRGGMGTTLLGSTAVKLVGRPDQPLLAYGPGAAPPTEPLRVIACVDGSEFSELSLKEGARWARALGTQLWIVQVVPPGLPQYVTPYESSYVHNLSKELNGSGIKIEWEVLHSLTPARSILDAFGEDPSNMVVMATHGRRGLQRLLLGSVATEVVRGAWGPVALIGPAPDLG
jgi:nucleotide-binding universal stress UspA family protein